MTLSRFTYYSLFKNSSKILPTYSSIYYYTLY